VNTYHASLMILVVGGGGARSLCEGPDGSPGKDGARTTRDDPRALRCFAGVAPHPPRR
jgi:hypothetical protein